MERRLDKKMAYCGVAAALCFAAVFAATFPGRAGRWQRPVAMVSFGDSVFTDIGGLTPIPDRLAERLGISFYNASMGGTCAARLEAERRLDSARGSMCLAGLAKAVRAGDFSVQQTARLREGNTEHFPEIAAGLAEIYHMDLDQIEYAAEVTMEHHLGLTCDPIGGLVQIPCIERNAVAGMRAINALSLANFLTYTRKISFDMVVKTMYETGRDLFSKYRETSEGGLAKTWRE